MVGNSDSRTQSLWDRHLSVLRANGSISAGVLDGFDEFVRKRIEVISHQTMAHEQATIGVGLSTCTSIDIWSNEGFSVKYPVLYYLREVIWKQGIDFLNQFIAHAQADEMEVDQVKVLGSETHQFGRITLLANLKNGKKYVYKPRPISLDFHYQNYLRLLNELCGKVNFKTIEVIDRKTYGWIEYLRSDTKDLDAEYYFRCGAILGVLFSLAGTDFHHENIISQNSWPILIDLEGLLTPQFSVKVSPSVLETGYLPGVLWLENRHENIEVSAMGRSPKITDFPNEFIDGFIFSYRLQKENFEELLNSQAWRGLSVASSRVLMANTQDYSDVLKYLYHPYHLQSFEFWHKAVENVYEVKDEFSESEKNDLYNLDVPYFSFDPRSSQVLDSRGNMIQVSQVFSGAENSKFRLSTKMNTQDLNRQIWFLKLSFECFMRSQNGFDTSVSLSPSDSFFEQIKFDSFDQIVNHVKSLTQPQGQKSPFLIDVHFRNNKWNFVDMESEDIGFQFLDWFFNRRNNESFQINGDSMEFLLKNQHLYEFNFNEIVDISMRGLSGKYILALNQDDRLTAKEILSRIWDLLRKGNYCFGDHFTSDRLSFQNGWAGVLFAINQVEMSTANN